MTLCMRVKNLSVLQILIYLLLNFYVHAMTTRHLRDLQYLGTDTTVDDHMKQFEINYDRKINNRFSQFRK